MFNSHVFVVALTFSLILVCVTTNDHSGSDNTSFPFRLEQEVAEYDTPYSFTFNKSVSYVFAYPDYKDVDGLAPPQVTIGSPNANKSHPIVVSVSQGGNILSWRLPFHLEPKHASKRLIRQSHDIANISRTLCEDDQATQNGSDAQSNEMTVSVSTPSPTNLTFSLTAIRRLNFTVKLNETQTISITPSEPTYFFYKFNKSVESVVLEVNSPDETCMTLSIQNKTCPVYDVEETVEYRGYWETITKKGGIMLMQKNYPKGFYIVFNVHGDNSACEEDDEPKGPLSGSSDRTKTIQFTLTQNLSRRDYLFATSAVILVFLAIYAAGLLLLLTKSFRKATPLSFEYTTASQGSLLTEPDFYSAGSSTNRPDQNERDRLSYLHRSGDVLCRMRCLYVSDLTRKHPTALQNRSNLYFWNIVTIAVFYSLPVVQLVYANQKVLNKSGNQDLCFYNFLCSHRFLEISDFNHVFSNISYVLYGILFMILVKRKQAVSELYSERGIPNHFGLYYAMGIALVMEGILSACYHICPNDSNIQFDTSFMYAIALLCMLKIYHARHPDITASAYTTYFLLACVIFIGMYGIVHPSSFMYIPFTVLHLLTCCYMSLQVYYMGHWKMGGSACKRTAMELVRYKWALSKYSPLMSPHRLKLLILGNIFNWGLVALPLSGVNNFSSYLLIIFLGNLGFYLMYYILMKILSGERILWLPLLLILLSIVSWTASGYFFFQKSINWKKSPAKSREFNEGCQLLNFYDNHDIWHMLSATSIFLSYMVLLTWDDDLRNTDRCEIVVF